MDCTILRPWHPFEAMESLYIGPLACTQGFVQFAVSRLLCEVSSMLYAVCSMMCAVFSAMCAVSITHYAVLSTHCALCSMHWALCTVQCTVAGPFSAHILHIEQSGTKGGIKVCSELSPVWGIPDAICSCNVRNTAGICSV